MSAIVADATPSLHLDGVEVVAMTPAHLDRVLEIEERVATTGWSRTIFERELADPDARRYVVAAEAGRILGYAGAQLQIDEAHITTVTVDPPARRRGVAGLLLVDVLGYARAWGATAATLEVGVDNDAARRLYARFGFRPVGLRPRYYDGARDALIMWAHDLHGDEFARLLRARDPRGRPVPDPGPERGD